MGLFDASRNLLNFPLGGLVIFIIGFVVFRVVLSFLLSGEGNPETFI